MSFQQDGKGRLEDDLIGYSWDKFLSKDATWLAQFPMTKASVRGMDVVEKVVKDLTGQVIEGFVVTGGSKEGWTSWLVGAVDQRVRLWLLL